MRPVVRLDFHDEGLNALLLDRLEGFTFRDRDNAADKVELSFNNDDQALTEYYPPGLKATFSWGFAGRMAQPRSMTIRKIKGAGSATLTMEGFSKEFELDRVKRTRAFESVTYIDIAQTLASEHGYPPEAIIVPSQDEVILPVYEVVNQSSETDAQFLRRLAKDLPNFIFWMDEKTFYFNQPKQGKRPRRVVEYRRGMLLGNVTGLESDLNLLDAPAKVTKKAYDPKTKKAKDASAGAGDEGQVLGGYECDLFGDLGQEEGVLLDGKTGTTTKTFSKDGEILYYQGGLPTLFDVTKADAQTDEAPTAETDQAGLQNEATQQLRKRKNRRIKFKLSMSPGDPYFQAKEIVELRGAGIFDGASYVKEAVHTVKAGSFNVEASMVKGYLGRKPKANQADMDEAGGEVNVGSAGDAPSTYAYVDGVSGEGMYIDTAWEGDGDPFQLGQSSLPDPNHFGGV